MRILSLSAVATELVCALGGVHLLVGRTDSCKYPESVLSIPSIGATLDITQEQISIFEPDLVLLGENQNIIVSQQTFRIAPQTIDDIYGTIIALGALLDKSIEADLIVHELRKIFDELHLKMEHFRAIKVYSDCDMPLYMRELIAISGGELYSSEHSIEAVTAYDPQMIITYGDSSDEKVHDLIVSRSGWQNLQAIKHERVFVLDEGLFRPTPRLIEGAKILAKILHGVTLNY